MSEEATKSTDLFDNADIPGEDGPAFEDGTAWGDGPAFSATMAHHIASKSPLHAWFNNRHLNPNFVREEKRKFDMGNAVHAAILEGAELSDPEHFDSETFIVITHSETAKGDEVVNPANYNLKATQRQRDAAYDAGKIPLLVPEVTNLSAAIAAFRKERPTLFRPGEGFAEHKVAWKYGDILCRSRVDWFPNKPFVSDSAILELKTTANAHQETWCRTTLWRTAAWAESVAYPKAIYDQHGVELPFKFVLVEIKPPYASSIVTMSGKARQLAEEKFDAASWGWNRGMRTGEWSAYPIEHEHEPPKYLTMQEGID